MRQKLLPILLGLMFVFYVFLSWILFFRDERALNVLGSQFYPQLGPWLQSTREVLISWKLNTVPTLLFALFIILAFFLYFSILKEKISAKKVVFFAVLFQIIVFFSYPILSTDMISYILSDRVAIVYHRNVWTTRPDEFKSDPYFNLSDWTDKTRIYGGVNQFFYNLATQMAGDDFLVNLAFHKLVVLVFVLATIAGTYYILAKNLPAHLSPGLALVFLNPLFILETIGSGHNDILMIFFVTLSIGALLRKKPLLVGLFLALATQVKSTPLLLAIFLSAQYFFQRDWRRMLKFLFSYGVVVGAIYYLMGVDIISAFTRTAGSINVYWQSLPMLVNLATPAVKPLLTGLLLLFLAWQGIRVAFLGKGALEVYGRTLLVYLLFFLAAFWNWYPIWILTILPFLPKSPLKNPTLAFTSSSLLAYVVYWVSLRLNYRFFLWPFIMYLTILSGPLVAMMYDRINKKA